MNEIINTSKGEYEFEVQEFVLGQKLIDRSISKDNLLSLHECFEEFGIEFGLIYGTLLGAVREGNFIEHDEDIDLFALEEEREKILDSLFRLREYGLEVGRYESEIISIMKDGEYIDIYFFKKNLFGKRVANGSVIDSKYLEQLEDLSFLGKIFKVPKNPEELLESIYGKNWRIPLKDVKGSNFGIYLKIKFFIRDNFSTLFTLIRRINNMLYAKG